MHIDPSHKTIYINQVSSQECLKGKLSHIPILGNIVNRMQIKKAENAKKLLGKAIDHLKNNDFQLAEGYFIKYAKCGYAEGFYILGKRYINKKNKVDQEKGINYLNKAAKSNHLESYLELAKIYEQKTGQDKKYSKEILTYYEKAEKLGSREASLALGYIYLYGYLAEKNLDKAIDLFGKAGSLRSGLADEIYSWKNRGLDSQEKYFYLAEIFIDSIKSDTKPTLKEKYMNEAISYYEISGKLGCMEAYLRLSPIYLYEKNDLKKRTECLEKAAELGSPSAKFILKSSLYRDQLL